MECGGNYATTYKGLNKQSRLSLPPPTPHRVCCDCVDLVLRCAQPAGLFNYAKRLVNCDAKTTNIGVTIFSFAPSEPHARFLG